MQCVNKKQVLLTQIQYIVLTPGRDIGGTKGREGLFHGRQRPVLPLQGGSGLPGKGEKGGNRVPAPLQPQPQYNREAMANNEKGSGPQQILREIRGVPGEHPWV